MAWQYDDGEDTGDIRKMGQMVVMPASNVIMILVI